LISGKKIKLRPARITDRKRIYRWMAHSDLTPSMMGPPHYPDHPAPTWEQFQQDYTEHFFKPSGDGKGRNFIIIADGEDVGTVGYDLFDQDKSRVVLDIWLSGEKYCGLGYGADALNTLCRHLRDKYGIRNFFISPSSRNKRAVAAYLKSGFRRITMNKRGLEDEFGKDIDILDYNDNIVMKRAFPPSVSPISDWYLYLIRCRDGSLYTGITTDVARRFAEHRGQGAGGAKYLKGRGPLELVLRKKVGGRSLALRVERKVKKLPKAGKEKLIKDRKLLAEIIKTIEA
jgi:predicted GIY-YIG superfamily endonuclease/RimJ/RimL family protein N-acetyltransferase